MIFVELETLTSGPFGRGVQPVTSADYWRTVDTADNLDWYWSGLTEPGEEKRKQAWWEQFSLNRNKLVFAEYSDAAKNNLLISRDLNLCRVFCAAGGKALWVDHPRFVDVSGDNRQFLAKCAAEGFDRAKRGLPK